MTTLQLSKQHLPNLAEFTFLSHREIQWLSREWMEIEIKDVLSLFSTPMFETEAVIFQTGSRNAATYILTGKLLTTTVSPAP